MTCGQTRLATLSRARAIFWGHSVCDAGCWTHGGLLNAINLTKGKLRSSKQKYQQIQRSQFCEQNTYPHVSFLSARCAKAIRSSAGVTAFDWAKIDDFKLEEVASGVNNVNHSVSLDGQAAFVLASITQAGPFFPCQNVSRKNEESLLNLKIESDSTRQDERNKTIHIHICFQEPF